MNMRLPSLLTSAELGPIKIPEARLSRGASLVVIGLLSALCWAVLISSILALWSAL
jgi:hypothetical protein